MEEMNATDLATLHVCLPALGVKGNAVLGMNWLILVDYLSSNKIKLITVNFPPNFLVSNWESLYIFASAADGSVLDVKKVNLDTQILVLTTENEIASDTEFMVTFANYSIDAQSNYSRSELATIQNLTTSHGELNLEKREPNLQAWRCHSIHLLTQL